MGRPSLGKRVQVNVRLSPDLVGRIDAARGHSTRDSWMAAAAELALRESAKIVAPDLHQPEHIHRFKDVIGTRFVGGQKFRVRQCPCGDTQEELA